MTEESMARLGFAFMILDAGWPAEVAARVAFDPELPASVLAGRGREDE